MRFTSHFVSALAAAVFFGVNAAWGRWGWAAMFASVMALNAVMAWAFWRMERIGT